MLLFGCEVVAVAVGVPADCWAPVLDFLFELPQPAMAIASTATATSGRLRMAGHSPAAAVSLLGLGGGLGVAAAALLEPGVQLGRRQRLRQVVALRHVAAEPAQVVPDRLGLDALRHHLEAQVAPEVD